MAEAAQTDWSVTEEKVSELVRRIVEAADPLEVIAFGSRARGDHREDSDLDLAVIVEDELKGRGDLKSVREGIRLEVDLLTIGKERYDRFRPWINTVHQEIDREGVRLYERGKQPSDRGALHRLCARRALATV